MPLPGVISAKDYRGSLLEPLALLVRALKEKGETIPPGWVEEEERRLRRGEATGWVSPPEEGEAGGILLMTNRSQRAFAHLSLLERGRAEGEGIALARALLEKVPEGLERLDLTISTATPEAEKTLDQALSTMDFPFKVIKRMRMAFSLKVHDPPASLPLPQGFRFRWASEFPRETLARLDYSAFEESPDRGLVAENLQEDERILGEIFDGKLGPFVKEGSPVIVREVPLAPMEPVALLLSLQQGIGQALIVDMAVSPGVRGQGLGRAMLSRALRGLVAMGFREVRLWVTERNVAACRLYEGAGFKRERSDSIFIWKISTQRIMP